MFVNLSAIQNLVKLHELNLYRFGMKLPAFWSKNLISDENMRHHDLLVNQQP